MIDIKMLQSELERIKAEVQKRNMNVDVDLIAEIDARRRQLLTEIESLRAEQNRASKAMPKLEPDEREKLISRMKEVSARIKELEPELNSVEEKLFEAMAHLPNFAHESVPVGAGPEDNVVERVWGKKPDFDFEPRSYVEICELLDLVDTERAAKVSGSRFSYLKNEAVLLEFALVQYALDILLERGFVPMVTPALVKERAMFGTGFLPAEETEYYATKLDDLYLIGTSEVSLCAYHADEILRADELPLRYAGFSSCFRREAGSYGKDVAGIFRVHQFDKVEMFIFCREDQSWQEYEFLLETAEKIVQGLGLCYRVMNMCTGEIAPPNAKKYDIEVWFPAQQAFREIISCSNDTDFQARRLNIRYRENKKLKFAHTMNSTACAIGRTLIAILENYQQADGTVRIPEALVPYAKGQRQIPFLRRTVALFSDRS